MKIIALLPLLLVLQSIIIAQTNLGFIVTTDKETIEVYKRPNKKVNMSAMEKDCDCQKDGGSSFAYVNKEGKVKKMSQSQIAKVSLKKGTRYCTGYQSRIVAGVTGVKAPSDFELFSLPIKKNGRIKVLQSIVFTSPKYILSMYQESDLDQKLYISTTSNNQFVDGDFLYGAVGFGKQGQKSLASIKRYFKDCTAIIAEIDAAVKHNKNASKRRNKIAVLQNTFGMSCQ